MSKKILIIFEDDWELMGNGLGNVTDLQYLPSLQLLNIADMYGIKLNFMVDVMQQIYFKKYEKKDRNIALQKKIWEECVLMFIDKGHDVQLHLHPQWHDASYVNGYFELSNYWNLGSYSTEKQKEMISESVSYLNTLIKPFNNNYHVHSFKAGSWGLQPSMSVLQNLEDQGIRLVMGVVNNFYFKTQSFHLDYRNLEEAFFPYYPNYNDLTKISKEKEKIVILPIHSYQDSIFSSLKRHTISALHYPYNKFKDKNDRFFYYKDIPTKILNNSPVQNKYSILDKMFNKYFHLHIPTPISIFKNIIDKSIGIAKESQFEMIPIVVESHTKNYFNNIKMVNDNFRYIIERYGDIVQFTTLSEIMRLKEKNNLPIKRIT